MGEMCVCGLRLPPLFFSFFFFFRCGTGRTPRIKGPLAAIIYPRCCFTGYPAWQELWLTVLLRAAWCTRVRCGVVRCVQGQRKHSRSAIHPRHFACTCAVREPSVCVCVCVCVTTQPAPWVRQRTLLYLGAVQPPQSGSRELSPPTVAAANDVKIEAFV